MHKLKQDKLSAEVPKPVPWVLFLSFIAALGSYLCRSVTEADFYLNLVIGRWIRATSSVPQSDLWTAAISGQSWKATNWLFQVSVSSMEDRFGWTGLIAFKLLLCCCFMFTLARLLGRLSRSGFFGGLLAVLVGCGVLELAPFDAELLGYVLFAAILSLGVSIRYWEGGLLSHFFVFLCSVMLTNTSASYLLLAFYAVLSLLIHRDRLSLIFAALIAAAVPVSPYFGAQIGAQAAVAIAQAKYYLQTLTGAATIFDYSFCFLVLLWVLAAFLGMAESFVKRFRAEIFLAGGLSIVALALKALMPFALIFSAVLAAVAWRSREEEGTETDLQSSFEILGDKLASLPEVGVVWVLFCVTFVNVVKLYQNPNIDWLLPKHEIDYVLEKNLPFPIWHESSVGPYVIYRLADQNGSPKKLAALDWRAVSAHPEMFWQEHNGLWRQSFNTFHPATVLVRTNTALFEDLQASPEWKMVIRAGRPTDAEDDGEKIPQYGWAVFVAASAI